MDNYYEILQVKNFAEVEVIKASYKALSKKYHPDVNKDVPADVMVKINEAYEVLSDVEKKEAYDEYLKAFLAEEERKNNNRELPKGKDIYNYEVFNDSNDGNKTSKNVAHTVSLAFRIPLSIIAAIVLGAIGSFIIVSILDSDSSWLFVLYTVYGSLMGTILGKISDCDSPVFAFFGALLAVVGMVFPYYWYYFDTIGVLYEGSAIGKIILDCTGEVIHLFLKEGFVRALFTVLTPVATFTAIIDRL